MLHCFTQADRLKTLIERKRQDEVDAIAAAANAAAAEFASRMPIVEDLDAPRVAVVPQESLSDSDRSSDDEPEQPKTTVLIKKYDIKHGQTGCSYQKLFGNHLIGAKLIKIRDPYFRTDYQLENLVELLKVIAANKKPEQQLRIRLVTFAKIASEKIEITSNLQKIRIWMANNDIDFAYKFSTTLHDRSIETDTGVTIRLGRGLDYFQHLAKDGNEDSRPCKATNIEIYKTIDGQIVPNRVL
ncbi:hypothetical protein SAMD00019534_008410 [Acytostelium subglobosum LB1]|uniref:hypothetical protein n=1 Tax=Acytostelium subglobosum LB1 TaxID=1410327 RepID=UPI000644C205|nr:hypothetical protein SAMD00019534_008410 [Acytostelium subglobosum LB1]GAM17666.1 hypothetical protein SAMD00019534_008410 [Acytostelium subglobosum LB1]|eukprot:XP_012758262.1 hypothetical protein SAMD00019534_008410 [Acytostelium subglobosum LB1]